MVPQTPTSDTPPRGPLIQFTASALFDGLTWADLREFVRVATERGVKDSEPVDLLYENDDYCSPLGVSFTYFTGNGS